jgi:flagella basal body P-ring formation protein FlgA
VSGEFIRGRDIATVVPQLASLPPDLVVSYSPIPGVQRFFLIAELQQLASRHGIPAKLTAPVCFSWPVRLLGRGEILESLRKSLEAVHAEHVDLEIIDECRTPVPEGEIVFPLQGLTAETLRPAIWNGYIKYAGNKKFSTWVRVSVAVSENRIVATHDIGAGEKIGPSDIKTTAYFGPLARASFLHKDQDATGKCAVRPIASGTVLSESMLALPQDVVKQQLVKVHIHCGAGLIETQGIAVESGYKGDVIKIRNPSTGRIFLGQINDHGIVTVVPGGEVGLVTTDKKS